MSQKTKQLRGHLRELVKEYQQADPIIGDLLAQTIQRSLSAIISAKDPKRAADAIVLEIDKIFDYRDRYEPDDF